MTRRPSATSRCRQPASRPDRAKIAPFPFLRSYAKALLVPAYLRSFAGVSHRRDLCPTRTHRVRISSSGRQSETSRTRAPHRLTFPTAPGANFPKASPASISPGAFPPSLAKRPVAMALDGVVSDLADPIEPTRNRIHHSRRSARAGADPARRRARAAEACSRCGGTQVTIGR